MAAALESARPSLERGGAFLADSVFYLDVPRLQENPKPALQIKVKG